ncbi:hypothetical protein EBZ38_17335 [bacterium]|jgi:hypothetical protein|nr:hypothetical protein [bacterium]NDD86025.1 hypothetical protein [bacterium]NDG20223.1 hypothetical protein [Betaproteobacteria bacterium]
MGYNKKAGVGLPGREPVNPPAPDVILPPGPPGVPPAPPGPPTPPRPNPQHLQNARLLYDDWQSARRASIRAEAEMILAQRAIDGTKKPTMEMFQESMRAIRMFSARENVAQEKRERLLNYLVDRNLKFEDL